MNTFIHGLFSRSYALFFFSLALTGKSMGCGLDWTLPKNHFDGVNERGNVSYWDKLGDLDLGDGLTVPLIVGFNSGRTTSSPYLGDGWLFSLLESNIVQVDNKRFLMVQPDGLNIRFHRKDETSTTLTGQSGWMAEISGNTITMWAKCGWKMIFTDGKITSITSPQNKQLTYDYNNGVVKEIDEDGAPILTVNTDASGVVNGVTVNGKQINFELGQKPTVENLNGQNVIGLVKPSLSKVTHADGSIANYKFSVDAGLAPTLQVSGSDNRSFSWDPSTRLIRKDGNWTYTIVPGTKAFADAQITRKNNLGQVESWFYDNHAGKETTQNIDGTTMVREWFTTGILAGKPRKYYELKPGSINQIVLHTVSYDDNGNVIRETRPGETIFYDGAGNVSSVQLQTAGKMMVYTLQNLN